MGNSTAAKLATSVDDEHFLAASDESPLTGFILFACPVLKALAIDRREYCTALSPAFVAEH